MQAAQLPALPLVLSCRHACPSPQAQQQLSPCDVAALEKCLKESKGDTKKVRPW